jgi:hypothetical protein
MAGEAERAFGVRYEKCRTTRESMKTPKIDVSSVHHLVRFQFDR